MDTSRTKDLLERAVGRYNSPDFVAADPISLPHRFSRLQDREIIGFWVAMLAWGQRKTIIRSGEALLDRMDGAPYDFVLHHRERERVRFEDFVHRTFQPIDALCFLEFFQQYYRRYASLETAFARHITPESSHVGPAIAGFHRDFFSAWEKMPERTRKHIATPDRGSTCKRINMFLRWMVRRDGAGVDFGHWQHIRPAQLLIPLDLHVDRVARRLGLLERPKTDWQAVLELTDTLRALDPEDPVKYDFALFGMGIGGDYGEFL